ncbi:hypothetical protein HHK36_015621 [Tetracentron sinense]|uniref:Alliinase C-terminal domain-containing protein n=1 Tax=Tetracentron sinense TaxID=13715 RepID=A0A834Z5I5_TETSI|nr:hypothetical protein HHK36_015621 [Tetracentron sinense]
MDKGSWRHILLLSLTLNVGLLSRVIYYERVNLSSLGTERENQRFQKFCFEENTRERKMGGGGGKDQDAHVSKSSPPTWTTRTEPEDGEHTVINLDHGDPTMFERFWQKMGDKCEIVIPGWQSMSYFSDVRNLCWFLEPEFAKQITRLHKLVGNAITEDRHIVVGTGSTQLFQAALYALSPPDASEPMSVVSAVPYYSSYPSVTNYLKSGLYKWAGDASSFNSDEPFIELVTSPNNPDGFMRLPVVNRSGGMVVHDLAYYWPMYTAITSPADHDIMLFTVSKSTGHAGIRIGWALVKDKEVAKKMTEFIVLNTIGVSKDSQLRAAKILGAVSDSCHHLGNPDDDESLFEYGRHLMAERWKRLRSAVKQSRLFSLPDFPSEFCNYVGGITETQPAFAWLKCEGGIEDCESFLRGHKILTRSGKHSGASTKYVRVSMLDRHETFDLFIERLSSIR